MKYFYFTLSLFFVTIVNAQKTVFDKEIKKNEIPTSLKVSEDCYKLSYNFIYCNQPKFNLEQNLSIPLIDGKIIIAEYKSSSLLKVGSVSYIYKIKDDIEGLVVFTVYKDFLVGSIMLGTGERYYISQVTETIFTFLKFNPNLFSDEECMSPKSIEEDDKINIQNRQNNLFQESTLAYNVCTDSPCPSSVVDIMVFFSNQTIASLAGGEIEAVAATSNQIVIGNQGYISSGINNLQFNLVYARALNYNDDPNGLSTDKSYIKYDPTLNALRNQYGADLVSLFTRSGTGIGDQPKTPTNFSGDNAYSAINYGSVIGYYSFLHETGHNLGIRHDWYEYQSDAADITDGHRPCSWNHGYSNLASIALGANSTENSRWRTILSYSRHFGTVGLSATRINRWSNPDIIYYGDPMGIHASASEFPSNEKFALERSGCVVANFRTSIITGTCPDTPTGLTSQSVCSGSNFSALTVTGTNIQWFNGPSFGTPIPITSTLVAGTYYASQTANGCESVRLAVTVTIGSCVAITGTISGNATICNGSTTQLSIALTGNGPWSGTLSDGTSFSSSISPLIIVKSPSVTTTYTLASMSNGVENATSGHMIGSVLVTVKESPLLTTITASASTTLCQGGRVNLTASAQSSSYFVTNNSNVSFINISATGSSVGTLTDESKHVISMPNFLYNKNSYTSATVYNNGVLVFGTETGNMGYRNGSLPSSFVIPNSPAAICAMWDDLYPNSDTSIKTATVNNKFIIQWTNEYHFDYRTSSGSTVTFQIQLDLISGQIHLVYLDVVYGNSSFDYGLSATVGLYLNATTALEFSWVSASLSNNKSITYSPHTISWSTGQTTPTITVSTAGNYTATVTNKNGCSATSAATSITINNSCFASSGTISGNSTVCFGSPAQLSIAVIGQGPWSGTLSDGTVFSGSVSPIIVSVSPTTSTNYTIATLSNGTTAVASDYLYDSAYVIVNPPLTLPIITANNPTTFCQGSSVNLSVSALPTSYNVNANSNISFIDISTTGTSIGTISDASMHIITIPDFTFNSISYTSATIFNTGVLVFGDEMDLISYMNSPLPSMFDIPTSPAAICALWDDLTPGQNSSIKTATINNKFIIQWTNELHWDYDTLGTVTFQIQLDLQSGQIHLVYQDVVFGSSTVNYGKSATIGLNFNATSAFQYSFNSPVLANNQSITFTPSFPVWSNGLTTPTISVSTSGNYAVTVTNSNGCSATSAITAVTVNQIPAEPSATSTQNFCTNATVNNLVATGTNIKWYAEITGGTALATATVLTTTTYYASQTINGCESSRVGVSVTISPIIAPTFTQVEPVCYGTAMAALPTTSNNSIIGSWSPALNNMATTTYTFIPSAGSCSSTTMTIAVGTTTTWNGTTWSNGTPTSTSKAIISGNYSGNINLTACSLEVTGTAIVTVPSGYNFNVSGAVTVASSASLTFENNANLLQQGITNSNTGTITVKRESAPIVRLDHTFWSSPVTGSQTLLQFSPNTLPNRFYDYSTASNVFTTIPTATTFVAGKGYTIRASNSQYTPLSSPFLGNTWLGTFVGTPNSGTINLPLSTAGTGYNLVGNPYPSPIDAVSLLSANANIGSTFYFYQHTLTMLASGLFPSGSNYGTWVSGTGGTKATDGNGHSPSNYPSGIIQVGQGFIIKSTGSNSLVFNNTMRVSDNNALFLRTTPTEKHRLWLNLKTETGTDINQILVGYIEGATQNVDANFDGLAFGSAGSSLTSKIDGNLFTIQGRSLPFNSDDVVPLGFKSIAVGNYVIELTNKDGLFEGNQDIFVRDNLMGIDHNLKIAPYTFASEIGTFDNRFELVYTQALGIPSSSFTQNAVIVYKNTDWFHVNTKGIVIKDIHVYDICGRLIFKQTNINATKSVLNGLASVDSVLFLRITSDNNEVVTVKVINVSK